MRCVFISDGLHCVLFMISAFLIAILIIKRIGTARVIYGKDEGYALNIEMN